MWKRRKHSRQPLASRLELCDLCGTTFPDDQAVRGHAPDSSSVHPSHDWFDGLRLITACNDDHFEILQQMYRSRPFVEEELWVAKITRVLTTGPPVLTLVQLACRTGLHEAQIRSAIAWHNERRHPTT
ncbi:hypothetical protein GCM10010276_21210 [Streptomyces longisporus]|uniref:HNH endonuclease n=1 Tax=Streptomyces longisporus TaxID=1948 RepID=A0ABN3LFK4_STRLO